MDIVEQLWYTIISREPSALVSHQRRGPLMSDSPTTVRPEFRIEAAHRINGDDCISVVFNDYPSSLAYVKWNLPGLNKASQSWNAMSQATQVILNAAQSADTNGRAFVTMSPPVVVIFVIDDGCVDGIAK